MPDEPEEQARPQGGPPDFDARLKGALAKREAAQAARAALEQRAQAARASSAAWRIMIDLVAAVGLTGALGFGLDRVAGTSPFGVISGLAGGFVLGMWLAARRAGQIQRQAQAAQDAQNASGAPPPKE